MSSHSVAKAKNSLSELINRALAGERIVITRNGEPVVELKPVAALPRRLTLADIEWLDRLRIPRTTGREDAGEIVSRLRDEEDR